MSQKGLNLSDEQAVRRSLGVLSTSDIEQDIKNPNSLVYREIMAALIEAFYVEFREEYLKLFNFIRECKEFLKHEVASKTGSVTEYGEDDEEAKVLSQEAPALVKSLENTYLNTLLEERSDLISKAAHEWRELQAEQVNRLAANIKDIILLDETDRDLLRRLHKPAEIMLTHPELIPIPAMPIDCDEKTRNRIEKERAQVVDAAVQRTDLNLLITLGRIAESKEGKYDLRFGRPPAGDFPDDSVYVYLDKSGKLYFSLKDDMGEVVNGEIEEKVHQDLYFRNIRSALEKNPGSPAISNETNNVLIDILNKEHHLQMKVPVDEVRRLSPNTMQALEKKTAPVLKLQATQNHQEDLELMKKQGETYGKKLKENADKIVKTLEADAKLRNDMLRAMGNVEGKLANQKLNPYDSLRSPFSAIQTGPRPPLTPQA